MKTKYEIILWVGSDCPDLSVEWFELDETEYAMQCWKENIEIAKAYIKSNPDDNNLPYISICKYREYREDRIEFSNADWAEADFCELPKYVQKKCSKLIEFQLSEK